MGGERGGGRGGGGRSLQESYRLLTDGLRKQGTTPDRRRRFTVAPLGKKEPLLWNINRFAYTAVGSNPSVKFRRYTSVGTHFRRQTLSVEFRP